MGLRLGSLSAERLFPKQCRELADQRARSATERLGSHVNGLDRQPKAALFRDIQRDQSSLRQMIRHDVPRHVAPAEPCEQELEPHMQVRETPDLVADHAAHPRPRARVAEDQLDVAFEVVPPDWPP